MQLMNCKINGVPYSQLKSKGNKKAAEDWTRTIIEQTKNLGRVQKACIMNVTFCLPPDKFPKDFPYGPDIDNLLKRLLDALEETIFMKESGGDSCIISINAAKTRVESKEEAGAYLQVIPVEIAPRVLS